MKSTSLLTIILTLAIIFIAFLNIIPTLNHTDEKKNHGQTNTEGEIFIQSEALVKGRKIEEFLEPTQCNNNSCWNGICNSEECVCFKGWEGSYCNKTLSCFGKSFNNSLICSGQGECNATDLCICNTDYFGISCEEYFCNSTLYNNTQVCNGRGVCSSPNYCICNDGFNGTFCDFELDRPVAVISSTITQFHKCQPITISGKLSIPTYGNPVNFYWTLQHRTKTSYVKQFTNSTIKITTTEVVPFGAYTLSLIVRDSITGASSLPKNITLLNLGYPQPSLQIDGKRNRTLLTSDVPSIFRKEFLNLDYSCVSKQEYNFTLIWRQAYGPFLDFTTDIYENLQINRLYSYGTQRYGFRVGTTAFDGTFYYYDDLEITTYSPDIQLRVVQYLISATTIHIEVEYYDPEVLNTQAGVWKWTCDPTCSTTLQTTLNNYGKSQSTSFDLTKDVVLTSSTFILTLTVTKGSRKAISSIETALSDKPIITVLDTEPRKTTITTDDILLYQIYSQSVFDTISSRRWTLNGEEIVPTNSSSRSFSSSDYVMFPGSSLKEGTDYTLSVTVSDTSGRLATNSYSFNVATNPIMCSCQISPTIGFALNTSFGYSCDTVCLKNQSVEIVFGYVEERTLVKIPLITMGEEYSTLLPSPYSGNQLTLFLDIVDTKTLAKVGMNTNVTILPVPFERNVLENIALWRNLYLINPNGNWNLNLYTACAISRVISSDMNNPNRTQCIYGVLNDGLCNCNEGFYSNDCSMNIAEFKVLQDFRVDLMTDMKTALIMQPDPRVEQMQLILIAIDSILRETSSLSTTSVSNAIALLDKAITRATETQDIIPSKQSQNLMHSSIEHLFKYFEFRKFNGEDDNMIAAISLAKKVSRFLMRNKKIGSDTSYIISKTIRLISNKMQRLAYKGSTIGLGNDSFVSFTGEVFAKAISKSNIPYSIFCLKDIFKLANTIGVYETGYIITPYVISPFSISIDFGEDNLNNNLVDYSSIVYTFPLLDITDTFNYSKTLCAYYDQSLKVVFGCSIKSSTAKSVSCTCNKLANVILVGEMKATTAFSFDWTLLGVIAITFIGVIILICCCIIVTILIIIAVFCRKRFRVEDEKSTKIKVAETRYGRSLPMSTADPSQSSYSLAAMANY